VAAQSTTVESTINDAATLALANAMYRFTFGIVVDGRYAAEGKGLGSGIGVTWKGAYLILTANHVIEETPHERMYFLLPNEALQFANNGGAPATVEVRKRMALEKPDTIQADDEDIAAIILPEQLQEQGRSHFYPLDEHHAVPSRAKQVGVLGYPGQAKVHVGANFMATVFLGFGELGHPDPAVYADHNSQISVSYPSALTPDPHGLSGSGVWLPTDNGSQALWSPRVRLIGLTTNHDSVRQELVGYRIERVIEFLRTNEGRMRCKNR